MMKLSTSFVSTGLPWLLLFLCVCRSLAQSNNDTCINQSLPNPIAAQYPDLPTGTVNATLVILPIPLTVAQQIIPYKILTRPYRALLPDFPADKYPVFFQAVHDHDIQLAALNFSVPDFSRAGFHFPFVDLLGDGYTSFSWIPSQLISSNNLIAIQGAQDYGEVVYPATFDPPCDAYRTGPGKCDTYLKTAGTNSSDIFAEIQFAPITNRAKFPYTLSFFKNITNQPAFGNGTVCDKMIRLFNTSISAAPFEPRLVKGTISANLPPMPRVPKKRGVDYYGIQLDTAFIEINRLECGTLQGYNGEV